MKPWNIEKLAANRHASPLALLVLLLCAPYLFCFASHRTFAPVSSLHATVLPFASGSTEAPPANHFWSDTTNFYWPRLHVLARGEVPISFTSGGGVPLFADTISGFFSPFSLLCFRLLPVGAHSLDLFWLLQTLVYSLGIYAWLAREKVSPWGCFTAAFTQGYCTAFFPGSYLAFQSLGSLAFLPWCLWAEGSPSARTRAWLPAVFLALSFYAGNIQTAVFPLLVLGAWALVAGRVGQGIWTGILALGFSLPLWLTGVQYHILLNVKSLGVRQSEVPVGEWGKLKALLALPGVLVPELLGSTKHIDLLKGLHTSATYFIGSIGCVGPLLVLSCFGRDSLGARLNRLALFLLALSLLCMVTPALNFVYYRVLCITCLALSLLVATHLEKPLAPGWRGRALPVGAILVAAAALVAWYVKWRYGDSLRAFFLAELPKGKYAWYGALVEARVQRWFADYLSTPHLLALPFLLLGAWVAARRQLLWCLLVLVCADAAWVWRGQVTFDSLRPLQNEAFSQLDSILRRSPAYPLSRFHAVSCGQGPFVFSFIVSEYQGVPTTGDYGSTQVPVIPGVLIECDEARKVATVPRPEDAANASVNALVVRSDWQLVAPGFHKEFSNRDFAYWVADSVFLPVLATGKAEAGAVKSVSLGRLTGREVELAVEAARPLDEWQLSLPVFPGWAYELDGHSIQPARTEASLPIFRERLTPGTHSVIARFTPYPLLWGLLGALAAFLLALWKSISTPA